MPSKSSRTIRIRGLPTHLLLDDFKNDALQLSKAASQTRRVNPFSTSASTAPNPECSLALQDDAKTGTVTFNSADVKDKVIKEHPPSDCDDQFDGLTVLHTADNVDLE